MKFLVAVLAFQLAVFGFTLWLFRAARKEVERRE